jgi:hypothetical protein
LRRQRTAPTATNGSRHPFPRVLNPGPSSSRAGDRNAAHHRSPKAADVTRFWLGRSGARRLLILQLPQRPRIANPHRSEQIFAACGKCPAKRKGKVCQTQTNSTRSVPASLLKFEIHRHIDFRTDGNSARHPSTKFPMLDSASSCLVESKIARTPQDTYGSSISILCHRNPQHNQSLFTSSPRFFGIFGWLIVQIVGLGLDGCTLGSVAGWRGNVSV